MAIADFPHFSEMKGEVTDLTESVRNVLSAKFMDGVEISVIERLCGDLVAGSTAFLRGEFAELPEKNETVTVTCEMLLRKHIEKCWTELDNLRAMA